MTGTHPPPAVAETHISTVAFVGDRAYKLLKPVKNDFLDFSTPDLRLIAVDHELQLNRRLSPDVYLGTADVVEQGRTTDRFLVMRRLPASRKLSAVVKEPGWEQEVRRVAREVARFHSSLPPLADVVSIAGRDAVAGNWEDNLVTMQPFVGTVLDEDEFDAVAALFRRYLANREELFDRRIAEGHVRDGHGDLTADDIFCLDDGPRILDCLAFDERLRISDVLADIAFLAMDLDRLAGPVASRALMEAYAEFANEHHPASLAHHYVAYRAHVRAKVACLAHAQGNPDAAGLARTYHALCRRHLDRAALRLVLVGGGPGTGKTTLANQLSSALGWLSLSSDELRKDLTGHGHHDRVSAGPGEGIYTPEITRRTYRELLQRSELLLRRGESVVVDATWSSAALRAEAGEVAARTGAVLGEVECSAPPDVARQRIEARLASGGDASDATPELVEAAMAQRDPWPGALRIVATDPPGARLDRALRHLRRLLPT